MNFVIKPPPGKQSAIALNRMIGKVYDRRQPEKRADGMANPSAQIDDLFHYDMES